MGKVKMPIPAKLIMGLLGARTDMLMRAASELAALFGPVDFASELLPFTYSDYYNAELGIPILRQFLSFEQLFDQGDLPRAKHLTNALEQSLAIDGKRTVNLDPGYITGAKLVLATTKDYNHRIYIGEGIYAEVTLHYHKGRFQPWPWTYPDYASPEYLRLFEQIRHIYMQQLRKQQQALEDTMNPGPKQPQSG